MVFEDCIQIALQVIASCISGVTGFWALVSPLVGLLNMFYSIREWQKFNWHEVTNEARAQKVVLTMLQILMLGFLYYLLFIINS